MKIIKRDRDLVSGEDDLEELFRIKDFPAYASVVDEGFENDVQHDLIFDISRTTGMVQIRDLMPLKLVYKGFHSEALGETWIRHHNLFIDFIKQINPEVIIVKEQNT